MRRLPFVVVMSWAAMACTADHATAPSAPGRSRSRRTSHPARAAKHPRTRDSTCATCVPSCSRSIAHTPKPRSRQTSSMPSSRRSRPRAYSSRQGRYSCVARKPHARRSPRTRATPCPHGRGRQSASTCRPTARKATRWVTPSSRSRRVPCCPVATWRTGRSSLTGRGRSKRTSASLARPARYRSPRRRASRAPGAPNTPLLPQHRRHGGSGRSGGDRSGVQ